MVRIQLQQSTWRYDPSKPPGPPGSFGQVYAGHHLNDHPVAVIKLHLMVQDAAPGELCIADELPRPDLDHVISVLDQGRDALSDAFFLVTARAEKSLQQEIDAKGALEEPDATAVLLDIAHALGEVSDTVHGNLNPANVLFHDGRWKVADFGIARLVEESTSPGTLGQCLAAPYAAPEQWRLERATVQTDVYALGCIAHALLTGKPPFPGPLRADFKRQHLREAPDSMPASARLRALVSTAMRKPPGARPAIDRITELLQSMHTDHISRRRGSGRDHLAPSRRREKRLREPNASPSHAQGAARPTMPLEQLVELLHALKTAILAAAPTARFLANKPGDLLRIELGTAQLSVARLRGVHPIPRRAFQASRADVFAGVIIQIVQQQPTRYSWGANLWYSRALDLGDQCRWREYVYMNHPLVREPAHFEPFALKDLRAADAAALPGMSEHRLAAEPRPIDGEDFDQFRGRWMELLVTAAGGDLKRPTHLPLT